MFENKTESQAKEEILALVKEYCETYHNQKKDFEPGDRITYAARVYDSAEMVNLVDSSLEFWLTSGRYTDQFEKQLAEYLNVRSTPCWSRGTEEARLAERWLSVQGHKVTLPVFQGR